mmetsp:Transcript_28601/g.46359  ORF Transcript_28601/g.46359 Transcript_28601/m.46359 type:complete len:161 (-) Transcript_28601:1207-1689(-)
MNALPTREFQKLTQTLDRVMPGLFSGQGANYLTGAAILAMTAQVSGTPRRVILAQQKIQVTLQDAADMVQRIADHNLHTDYVKFLGQRYIITSIHDRMFHGRNANITRTALTVANPSGGGIIIIRGDKVLLVATYAAPVLAATAVPWVDRWGRDLVHSGY